MNGSSKASGSVGSIPQGGMPLSAAGSAAGGAGAAGGSHATPKSSWFTLGIICVGVRTYVRMCIGVAWVVTWE